jgi:hypothetical protein
MSSPPAQPAQPHLVTLVLQSKKALQHGEQLCSRAHAISNASARTAVDVVALDAKVRWVTEAVGEQLKVRIDPDATIYRCLKDSWLFPVGSECSKEHRRETRISRATSTGSLPYRSAISFNNFLLRHYSII